MAEHVVRMSLEGTYKARDAFLQAQSDLNGLMRTTASIMGTVNMFIGSIFSLESAMSSATYSQQRITDAVRFYGAHSREAEAAVRQAEMAGRTLTRTQMYMAYSVVSTTASILAQTKALGALSATATAFAATNPWMIPLMLAGLAIGAVALTGAFAGGGGGSVVEFSPVISIESRKPVEDAIDELGYRLKEEARRVG